MLRSSLFLPFAPNRFNILNHMVFIVPLLQRTGRASRRA